ncbi:hypothetical protein PQX77_007495 [Marasmius sp. AFHP31]|nr:hypothetical protein PQX77_007495 [Marasmius sp. AFHP31]
MQLLRDSFLLPCPIDQKVECTLQGPPTVHIGEGLHVEERFNLRGIGYGISWKHDDGEIMGIEDEENLTKAIEWFQQGLDDDQSKIVLRLTLASLGKSQNPNGSGLSFSRGAPSVDLDEFRPQTGPEHQSVTRAEAQQAREEAKQARIYVRKRILVTVLEAQYARTLAILRFLRAAAEVDKCRIRAQREREGAEILHLLLAEFSEILENFHMELAQIALERADALPAFSILLLEIKEQATSVREALAAEREAWADFEEGKLQASPLDKNLDLRIRRWISNVLEASSHLVSTEPLAFSSSAQPQSEIRGSIRTI